MPKITVDWNTVINFVTDAFVGVGVPREDAKSLPTFLLSLTVEVSNHTA